MLVRDLAPVLIWALLSLAILAILELSPGLKQRFAERMYAIDRVSYGDFYFAIGVVVLYLLSSATFYTYAVPLAILSYADATSALVGKRFGRHKFQATEGRKSIEGSLAFFVVAFLAVILWSPTLPNALWWQILLIAFILGFLMMLVEAIAWRGLDNLFIPLGGYLLLYTYLKMSLVELLVHTFVALGIVIFALLWRRRTTLRDSALITAALFGYIVWTVPGEQFGTALYGSTAWTWLAAPALLFIVYNFIFAPRLLEKRHPQHNVDAVIAATIPGALWLAAAFYFNREDFVFPYTVSFATVMVGMLIEERRNFARSRLAVGVVTLLAALTVITLGALTALQRPDAMNPTFSNVLMLVCFGIAGILVAGVLALLLQKRITNSGGAGTSAPRSCCSVRRWRRSRFC